MALFCDHDISNLRLVIVTMFFCVSSSAHLGSRSKSDHHFVETERDMRPARWKYRVANGHGARAWGADDDDDLYWYTIL